MIIRGKVNVDREAELDVLFRGIGGRADKTVRVLLDTGFDRYLSLPPDTVAELGLPFSEHESS